MWKRVLAIGVLFAVGLPVYGKQESGKPGGNQDIGKPAQQPPPPRPTGVVTCAIKQDGTTIECHYPQANPQSYLCRLFSAENLPNLLLFAVGLGGIGVAIRSLRKLERQTKSTEQAVEIAQQTLVHTQRPKIIVRTFYFPEVFGTNRKIPNGIAEGSTASGQFQIVNTGGTKATIEEILCDIFTTDETGLPTRRPYEGKYGEKVNIPLDPGQSIPQDFGFMSPLGAGDAHRIATGMTTFYVLGWIGYRDDLGIYRQTRFCRRYNTDRKSFIAVLDEPDYESAD